MKTLKSVFAQGPEEFAKHCLRYGDILGYQDYIDHANRECRIIDVSVQGALASITKCRGDVVEVSYA